MRQINSFIILSLILQVFDRVYCKYHYLEGHEFDSTELELLHFLKSFYNETWDWYEQYQKDANFKEDDENDERDPRTKLECGLF